MIKEEYVQYDTAKLLKDAGFPQKPGYKYSYCVKQPMFVDDDQVGVLMDGCMVSDYTAVCPTQAQAMRWLREKHHIHVSVRNRIYDKQWDCLLVDINGKIAIPQDSLNYVRDYKDYWVTFPTYEAAAEAGIQAACKYLLHQK